MYVEYQAHAYCEDQLVEMAGNSPKALLMPAGIQAKEDADCVVRKTTAPLGHLTWHPVPCTTELLSQGSLAPTATKGSITPIGCASKANPSHSAEPTLHLSAPLHLLKKTNFNPDL